MSDRVGNAGQVRAAKMPRAYFEEIEKDPDVLYFVNDTGTFDPLSFVEEDGDIYLGDKLLTAKPLRFSCPLDEVWVSAEQPVHQESKAYDISSLSQADHVEIMADLLLANHERNQHQALFYIELCMVTEGSSEGFGTPTPTYTVQSVLASQMLELPSGSVSQARLANAHLHATIYAKLEENMAIRVGWAVYDDNNGLLQPVASTVIDSEFAPISKITIHAWHKKS